MGLSGPSAAGRQVLVAAGAQNTISLWDLQSGKELRALSGHPKGIMSVVISSDGQILASAGYDKTVKLWDTRTGQERMELDRNTGPGLAPCIAMATNGQLLALANTNTGAVKLWDPRRGKELRTLTGHTARVHSMAFSGDGLLLASASGDKTVKVWDTATGGERRTLHQDRYSPGAIALSTNGRLLALAHITKTISLLDVATGAKVLTLRGHAEPVRGLAFSPDGQLIASADNELVKLWDARTGQELRTLSSMIPSSNFFHAVAFSADGQLLVSATRFGIRLWDTRISQDPQQERRFRDWVTAPDLLGRRAQAQIADRDKRPFALAFHLGQYLRGQSYYVAGPREAASAGGWFATGPQPLAWLGGLPTGVRTPLHEPTFPDGVACTGVLYKESNIAPARLLIGTARALEGNPASWLNHAFHGGALYRNREYAKAQAALTRAVELRRQPSPLTHHLLALTCAALDQKDKAREYLKDSAPAKDAPWEDGMLDRLLRPEVEAALGKDGK
jgi:WD40 repeat protein